MDGGGVIKRDDPTMIQEGVWSVTFPILLGDQTLAWVGYLGL